MCQEIFEIVQSMDLKSVETSLALNCAPLITGVKISNLLMIDNNNEAALRVILKKSGVSHFRLLRLEEKSAFILFRRSHMETYLARSDVRKVLVRLGYDNFSFGHILRTFQERYQAYMNHGEDFPHEMGLLLGYPIEDVIGFMENDGANYLYSGYWKVYSDVSAKKKIFEEYEIAKETIIQLLSEHMDMKHILEIYKYDTPSKLAI